jgi:hypothetical protein
VAAWTTWASIGCWSWSLKLTPTEVLDLRLPDNTMLT